MAGMVFIVNRFIKHIDGKDKTFANMIENHLKHHTEAVNNLVQETKTMSMTVATIPKAIDNLQQRIEKRKNRMTRTIVAEIRKNNTKRR